MRKLSLAIVFVTCSAASQAADLSDGEYSGLGDGYKIEMSVAGDTAKILSVQPGSCSGSGTGDLSKVGEDHWRVTMTEYGQCVVDIKAKEDGFELTPDHSGDCGAYSGQACGFYGNVSPN